MAFYINPAMRAPIFPVGEDVLAYGHTRASAPANPAGRDLLAYGSNHLEKLRSRLFYLLRKKNKFSTVEKDLNIVVQPTIVQTSIANKFSALKQVFDDDEECIEIAKADLTSDQGDLAVYLRNLFKAPILSRPKIDVGVQAHDVDVDMQTMPSYDTEKWTAPSRKNINKLVKNSKSYRVYDKLYYHLRTKHFMRYRDPGMINSLVQDARIWLAKNKMQCENSMEYSIMTTAVMTAFLPDDAEMSFRAEIKKQTNFDNINHLNKTLQGDLGKSFAKTYLGGFRENSHNPLSSVRFPTAKLSP